MHHPLELNPAAAGKPRFARPFIVDDVCGQSEPALRSRFFCGQTAGVSLLASESLRERSPLLPAPSHSLLTVHQEPGQLMGPRRSFQTSTAFRSPAGYDNPVRGKRVHGDSLPAASPPPLRHYPGLYLAVVILSLLVMAYTQRGFMELLLLADEPSAAGMVASWYFDEWCRDSGHYTQDQVLAKVMAATHVDRAPLIVLARQAGEWVGAAELKIREMAIFPEYEYWLGGVYVVEKARGQGVASLLITEILSRARGAEISKLYLQTENLTGGVYCRHGFKAVEHVNYKGVHVLVMVADTGIPSSPVLNSVDTWTAEQPPEPPGN